MSENKEVKLTTGSGKKKKSKSFNISQANKLLSLSNAQWKLDDPGFKWNGIEIAVVNKAKKKETE